MNVNNQISIKNIFVMLRNGNVFEGTDLLYRYHYRKLYGVAFSIVKKEDASQDIVHNVIYKFLQLLPDKFPSENEFSWLYTVVKNEALMFLRTQKNTVTIDDVDFLIAEDKNINQFVDMDSYNSIVKELSETQRQIITLKVLGGFTHKEISYRLGKPIGTVQWLYNTSIKKLRVVLSSIFAVIIFTALCFIKRLTNYVEQLNSVPETSSEFTVYIPFDYSIVTFVALCLISIIAFVIIYKNSYKIPTKAERKNI